MWYAGERIAAEPYDDGELKVTCTANWFENEQAWTSIQFIPIASMLIICKNYLCNIYEMEFSSFYSQRSQG